MDALEDTIIQYLAFKTHILSPADILHLGLACKRLSTILLTQGATQLRARAPWGILSAHAASEGWKASLQAKIAASVSSSSLVIPDAGFSPAGFAILSSLLAPLSLHTLVLRGADTYGLDYGAVFKPLSSSLRTLKIPKSGLDDDGVEALVAAVPQLTSLDASESLISDDGLAALGAGLPNLVWLSVAGDDYDRTDVGDEGLVALASSCPRLEVLNVGDTNVTDAGLTALAAACPSLASLNVRENDVTDATLAALASSCPAITGLNLASCDVTDAGLATLAGAPFASSLTSLDVYGNSGVTDAGFVALLAKCPNLSSITIGMSHSEEATAAIASLCHLTHVDLGGARIAPDTLAQMAVHSPGLKTLNLYGNAGATDEALAPLITRCTGLTSLLLCGTPITDATVTLLASSCPSLSELYVYNTDVTDAGIASLVPLAHLVDITVPTAVTDQALASLCTTFPSLKHNRQ